MWFVGLGTDSSAYSMLQPGQRGQPVGQRHHHDVHRGRPAGPGRGGDLAAGHHDLAQVAEVRADQHARHAEAGRAVRDPRRRLLRPDRPPRCSTGTATAAGATSSPARSRRPRSSSRASRRPRTTRRFSSRCCPRRGAASVALRWVGHSTITPSGGSAFSGNLIQGKVATVDLQLGAHLRRVRRARGVRREQRGQPVPAGHRQRQRDPDRRRGEGQPVGRQRPGHRLHQPGAAAQRRRRSSRTTRRTPQLTLTNTGGSARPRSRLTETGSGSKPDAQLDHGLGARRADRERRAGRAEGRERRLRARGHAARPGRSTSTPRPRSTATGSNLSIQTLTTAAETVTVPAVGQDSSGLVPQN